MCFTYLKDNLNILEAFTSILSMFSLILSIEARAQLNSPSPSFVYWQADASEIRKSFESQLIELIFAQSESVYGRAKVEHSNWRISSRRSIELIKEGKRIHIQIAPTHLCESGGSGVRVIQIPVLKNLLGYRKLIIRENDVRDFKGISTYEEFAKLVAGQGRGWADVDIYASHGIPVVEAPGFMGLFPMLEKRRFDYIPLGVNEALSTLNHYHLKEYEFQVFDGIIIFYPWPVYICVSSAHPQLSERIEFGFEKIIENHQYENLYNSFYGYTVSNLKKSNAKIIYLKMPGYQDAYPVLIDNWRKNIIN